jgi:hypothetical protein
MALWVFSFAGHGAHTMPLHDAASAHLPLNPAWTNGAALILFIIMTAYGLVQFQQRRKAAMLALLAVGLFGGIIHGFNPGWSYTALLDLSAGAGSARPVWPDALGGVALFCGAIISSVLQPGFSVTGFSWRSSIACLTGGFLMGAGSKWVPGGNDSLMLWSIPGRTLYGPVAYLLIVLTIGLCVAALNRMRRPAG